MKKLNFLSMTFAFLLCILFLMSSPLPIVARAEVISAKYSNVLEDLQKDENFDTSLYPEIANDYSLQVIQIAESTDKKLFIYAYQPSHNDVDLLATSINISLTGKAEDVKNYTLTLISSSSVFDKYIVNGLTVSEEQDVRTYHIPSIFRAWNKNIDEDSGTDNVINEVVFEVAQTWYATEENERTIYRCKKIEVITITDRWDGFVEYDAGFDLFDEQCRSHFIAFNTDKKIDELLEATVSFYHQDVVESTYLFNTSVRKGDLIFEDSLKLTSTQEGVSDSLFPWDKIYTWNRILSSEEFLKDPDVTFSDTAKKNISSKAWVLRFYESHYMEVSHSSGKIDTHYTDVTKVTILRLKFNTDGQTYDLGAVDNKMTADLIPDGHGKDDAPKWWPIALAIVLVCVAGIVIYKSLEDKQ